MSSLQKNMIVITNLYPVPWAPNRATFNKQQFGLIAQKRPIKIIIMLPWLEWIKHRSQCTKSNEIKYCPYFYIPKFGRRLVPLFQVASLLFYLPWIKRQQPSSLLASWAFPDAVATSMLNKFLKIPFFVKVHGTDVNENIKHSARSRLMKKWLNKASAIFCASQALANGLQSIGIEKTKLSVNYNGVDPKVFYPPIKKQNQQHFVFVGNLITTKGLNELIEAFLQTKVKFPNIQLDILGDGPLKGTLVDKISEHKLAVNLRLLGSVPLTTVALYIRNANILVLPSYREGVPNVLLESFASGTPIISTKVGGIPEVVNSSVGLLVDAKSVTQLSQAMEKAISMPWSTKDIIQHSHQFDWQKNVQHILKEIVKSEINL
jgi:glycosyltransferase involved in cell wall biosynthesis